MCIPQFVFNDIVVIANEKWKVKHILDMRTLDIKRPSSGMAIQNGGMKKKSQKYKFGDITKMGVKKVSMVRQSSDPIQGEFPEFHLISCGQSSGSVTYVAQSKEDIDTFAKVVGVCRLEQLQGDIRNRGETLGSLKMELGRQFLMYK